MKCQFKLKHVVLAALVVKAVLYGGAKPAGTNAPPDDASSLTNAAPPVLTASRPRLAMSSSYLSQSSYSSQLVPNWTARGAYCDWQPITFSGGFRFPVGTNLIDGVTLFAYGEIRENIRSTPTPSIYTLPAALAIEPNASSLTHGLTPSNSYLFAWHNCCVERCATNRADASIELFRNGAVAVTLQPTNGLPTTVRHPPTLPEGFVGCGQDEDWIRANLPDDADYILSSGYASWLSEWVGVDEQNGRYKASVTIAALPADGSSCCLSCGPYKVNVTEPGTYSFPLEVFETYEVTTWPVPVPFTIAFDDGYTGAEQSYEIVNANPRPRLLAAPSGLASPLTSLLFYMKPLVIVSPSEIPLSEANGSRVSVWCNLREGAIKTYRAVSRELYLTFFASDAEIHDAYVEDLVEVIFELDGKECRGEFRIVDDTPEEPEEPEVPEREDDTVFSGETHHNEVSNDCVNVYLTATTVRESTATGEETTAVGLAEGQSADVYVYMATSESGDDQYDDTFGWTVTANGTVGLQGSSSVSAHANAVGGLTYGVVSGAVLLASGHFSPPADDILRLRLLCWAQNAGDGKKETCIQIVVIPRE